MEGEPERHQPDRSENGPCHRERWLPLSALIAFLLASLPLFSWYVQRVIDRSDEPLGVIALVVAVATLVTAAGFGHHDRRRIRLHPWRMLAGAGLLALVQWFGPVRLPLVAGLLAVAVVAVSVEMPRGKAGVIALLVLSLPLVASLDFFAGYPLRLAAAELGRGLLWIVGIEAERNGVLLLHCGRLVGIDPACAGVRMLWTACFLAAVLAVRMRLSWRRTLGLLGIAIASVVAGNGLRAALVFLPEAGRVHWPEWMHPGVGLLVHGLVLGGVFFAAARLDRLGRRCESGRWWLNGRRLMVPAVAASVIAGALVLFVAGSGTSRSPVKQPWPAMLDGVALVELPLSDMEQRFARSFPGQIGRFSWGDREVIMRCTIRPTRRMHPAEDCLRAAGYQTRAEPLFRDADGGLWGCTTARKDGRRYRVLERYLDREGKLLATDASAWFWQAMAQPDEGPWTGITVIEELGAPLL
jgi:exosortase/archaeosortase family protein